VSFGSSSGSNLPRTAYVTKYDLDPTLPSRMWRSLLPYNNDFVGASGSAGRQVNKTVAGLPGGPNQTFWFETWYRRGGTLHPATSQAVDYSHDGDFPAGAVSRKLFYFETDQAGNRIGLQFANAAGGLTADFGWGQVGAFATGTELGLTIPGFGTNGWSDDSETFTGQHLYRHIHNVIRTADVIVRRRFRQRMTDADGHTYNPQPPVCSGVRVVRLTGVLSTMTSCKLFNDNLNKTVKQHALPVLGPPVSWDSTDQFASTNIDTGAARAEGSKPWDGAVEYIGPTRLLSGGDGRPLDDDLGHNFDDAYRGDPNWPAGV
jgi:hypothetical protein